MWARIPDPSVQRRPLVVTGATADPASLVPEELHIAVAAPLLCHAVTEVDDEVTVFVDSLCFVAGGGGVGVDDLLGDEGELGEDGRVSLDDVLL